MTDLFTLAEFKTHVGIPTGVTSHDALIAELAGDVTEMVDDFLRRKVEQVAYQEIHDGTGKDRIRVKYPPIAASPAPVLYVSGEQKWDSDHLVAAGDFVFEAGSGLFILLPSAVNPDLFPQDAPTFNKGVQNVRIDYTGGWLAASRPKPIKRAAIIWAVALFNQRRASGIGSRTVAGVTFSPSSRPVPPQAMALLSPYRMPFRMRTVGAP